LSQQDEAAFHAAHDAMAVSGFAFGLDGFSRSTSWASYLEHLAAIERGVGLEEGRVPATFLVADVDGEIVGRSSIRHRLTENLRYYGGHIGYAVLPVYRRRGYATAILTESLEIARSLGIERCLVTCDESNVASAAVIERCGGELDWTSPAGNGRTIRRYWI
jgi:predicted acetyltransferase